MFRATTWWARRKFVNSDSSGRASVGSNKLGLTSLGSRETEELKIACDQEGVSNRDLLDTSRQVAHDCRSVRSIRLACAVLTQETC